MSNRGRPSTYTDAIGEEICARLAEGETLSAICRDEHMPPRDAVYDWRVSNQEFGLAWRRAHRRGIDKISEDCLQIADDRAGDRDPNSRKVRVWTRLQLLAKWDPSRYGDAVTVRGDKKRPLRTVTQMTDDELAAIAQAASANPGGKS